MRPGGAVTEAMHQIEGIEERGRDWYGTIDAQATFLPTLEREDGRLEIHPIGRERQGFGGATARMEQRPAIRADLGWCGFRGLAECRTLRPREVEAVTLRVINLHASGGGHRMPVIGGLIGMDFRSLADTLGGSPSPVSGAREDPRVGVHTASSNLLQDRTH